MSEVVSSNSGVYFDKDGKAILTRHEATCAYWNGRSDYCDCIYGAQRGFPRKPAKSDLKANNEP